MRYDAKPRYGSNEIAVERATESDLPAIVGYIR